MERGQVRRMWTAFTVTFVSGSPTSNGFAMPQYGGGTVWLPSGFTGFGVGLQVFTGGGTPTELVDGYNAYGADVSISAPAAQLSAARAYPFPGYWFGTERACLWSHNGAGSGIPQTSGRTVGVFIKS